MNNYVIVGNGTAAIGCVEGIRSVDKKGKITIISSENHPAYCRPLISYYLENKTTTEKISYRPENFYVQNDCSVLYGTSAVKLDLTNKAVQTNNNKSVKYDKLCIATGSSPFVPPMKNMENVKNKFSFLTLDDAIELKKAVCHHSRVLIIGAGLIGLKCAEGLYATTSDITVCDLADHVLSSILGFDDAKIVQNHLEEKGIRFFLGNSVTEFENNTAIMKNGERVSFDILVTAVGVRPNTGIFREAGGECGRGITIDGMSKTSIENVFAAGDCTESLDITDEKVKIMALMPNAYMQGFTAGVNMAGGSALFDNAMPMNSIGFFGFHLMSAGAKAGIMKEYSTENSVRRFYFDDSRLIGYVLIGNVKNAGIYTNLIRNKYQIENIDDENFDSTPSLSLYSAEKRRKMLESVV